MKVTVVGMGALGSHFLLFARSFAELKGIDDGRVKGKSPLAQFHAKTQVDRSKAQSIQQTLQFLFGTKVSVVPHRLVVDNVQQLLADSDLLVDCLDNGSSREL